MILEKDSFPLPLSPVINTDISVGATCMATLTAWFSRGEFPIMPNRCFILCISCSVAVILLVNYFSHQCRSCAVFYKHIDILTFFITLLRENNNLVGGVPALHPRFGAFRGA